LFLFSFYRFSFDKKLDFCWPSKHKIVATSIDISNLAPAPLPSVCIRVPHSPSLDSGENSVPTSPVEREHHDFATLVVRESKNSVTPTSLFLYRSFTA
jgi:hypothetical protein